MGREGRRPDAYHPSLQLNLRRDLEGGGIREPAAIVGLPDAIGRTDVTVLVHGFNNTDSEAAIAYFAFRARETEITDPMLPLDGIFADAFWPGDAHWWGWFDRADAMIYPASVGTARRSAGVLAAALLRMPHLQRVQFVGHSLGARVVLETLPLLLARPLPRVERVCLMAAAVPSEMLEPGGRFFELMRELQARRTEVYVLHSMQDVVLHGAFPVGQRLAGPGEASTRALGRFGPTAGMPGFGDTLRHDEVSGAGHSNYWGHVPAAATRKANELTALFMDFGVDRREIASARPLSPRRPLSAVG